MPGAVDGKFTIKSCGKAHAWCAECRPVQAAAQRKPKRELKVHTKPCRDCGRCDDCLGITAPDGMKVCRSCGETKSVDSFARRKDTGGRRNQCIACRNKGTNSARCTGCGERFTRAANSDHTLCGPCRPAKTKDCVRCGAQFVDTVGPRRYCSATCRDAALDEQRRGARQQARLEALQAYSTESPRCVCCGEGMLHFLALDHINGGGRKHRQETGGGGFYSWLKRHNYPPGFQVLCHNCNLGRQFNGGTCPHQER